MSDTPKAWYEAVVTNGEFFEVLDVIGYEDVESSPLSQSQVYQLARLVKRGPVSQATPDQKRTAACYPTPEEINALPDRFRQYIHDLETRCDKSGDVQTIALLREDREALQKRVEELEAAVEKPRAL